MKKLLLTATTALVLAVSAAPAFAFDRSGWDHGHQSSGHQGSSHQSGSRQSGGYERG